MARNSSRFFNGHYDSWCYLPLLGFLTFNDEKEQYLCAAMLRPGKAVAADGALSLLCRLLPMLRAAFPSTPFLVRLDGGFATPEILDFPGCRTGARLRGRDEQERGVAAACRIRDGRGPRAERGQRPNRARLYRHPLRGRNVGPRAPGRDKGGSGPAQGSASRGTIHASS